MPKASKASKANVSGKSTEDGAIIVTSQQSRFHVDANNAPTLKDIDVKDLTVSIGGHEILDHAHLRINDGVHYVFHGRNGTGKSTLLKALAERRVPGVAPNLRILLLGQTRISSDVATDEAEDGKGLKTVLEYVTKSDSRRERALRESQKLTTALEGKADAAGNWAKVIRQLQLEHAEQELAEAQLTAARRSGARGAKARQALIDSEKAVEDAKQRYNEAENAADGDADLKTGIDMLESTRLALEAMDAGSTEARARTVLLGLGFSLDQIEQPVSSLSGGWQTRCDLACALIQQADVLMLDEPTNFLDLPAVIWLQRYIKTTLLGKTVVVVTHDRDFADAVAEELLLLRLSPAKSLETFRGDLTEYENEKRRQIRRMTKMSEALDKKTKHMEETVVKNLKAAKRTGDDKKLKQAASRKKKLEERTGLEVSATGGRFKLNRDRAGWNIKARADIEIPEFDPPVSLALPDQPLPLRHPGAIASLEKVSFSWPKSGVWTLKDIDLVIHPGDRIGLAGLNGSGKSTLIKLLMGAASGTGLRPIKGVITLHSKARISCYSQHAVEELESLGKQEPERTALLHLSAIVGSDFTEQDVRTMLAKLGLRGNLVSEVPLASLSGGQRVRLALAQALFGSPHLLILDEVTTHLDADTIVALIEELRTWEGALLVVTHDRYFMRCVVEREKVQNTDPEDSSEGEEEDEKEPGTVNRLRKAGLQKLVRGMAQYEELVEKSLAKLGV